MPVLEAPTQSQVQDNNIHYQFSSRQMEALNVLRKIVADITNELLYGGSKGGGKSVLGCRWVYIYAKEIIQEYGLPPQTDTKKIPVIGFMGRKQGTNFSSTTMLTWKKEVPPEAYELRYLEGRVPVIIIEGRVAIMYGGMDNEAMIKKFNSAEFLFYFVDQAEEFTEEDIALLRGTLRGKVFSRKTRRMDPPSRGYKGLLTANPAKCWLKTAFVRPETREPGNTFIKALPRDNPFLPPGYIDDLRRAFKFNPALAKAYIEGSWDDLDEVLTVILQRYVEWCVDNPMPMSKLQVRKVTVVDVAEMGEDETVIYDLENASIVDEEIYAHRDPMDTVGRVMSHAKKNGSNMIVVDKIGVGSGVYSRLQEIFAKDLNMEVYGFDSRIKPPEGLDEATYVNYKTFAWFTASNEIFAERKAGLPRDPELVKQLCGVTYHFENEKMRVDNKEDIKEVLKKSPSRADALIMGLDGVRRAKPVKTIDRWGDTSRSKDYPFNADTV